MQILVACKYFKEEEKNLTPKCFLNQLSPGATMGGVGGRVVRTTDVRTERIQTSILCSNLCFLGVNGAHHHGRCTGQSYALPTLPYISAYGLV